VRGTVTRVLISKGYAFVRGDADGLSRFAHVKDFLVPQAFEHLREGQQVRFTPVVDPKGRGNGLRAIEIDVDMPAESYWDRAR